MTLPAFNPVALKELRQLTRTRIISILLVGYPLLLLVVFGFAQSAISSGVSPMEAAYGKGLGQTPFTAIGVVTAIATCLAIPLVTSIKTVYEYIKGRMGLEFTTTLSSAQIINGKLMAATILSATLIAVSMPFFAITYLMRGVELAHVFIIPVLLLLYSLAQSAACLPIATSNGTAPIMRLLLLLGINGFAFAMSSVATTWLIQDSNSVTGSDALMACLGLPLFLIAVTLLARSFAAAQISPPFIDGERPLRRTAATLFVLSAPVLFFSKWPAWCICWSLASLLLLARGCLTFNPMPRSVIAKAPKSRFLRLLAYPFTTGPISGQFFAILLFAIAAVVAFFLSEGSKGWLVYLLCFVETIALMMLASSIGRKIGSPRALKITMVIAGLWIAFAMFSNALESMDALDKSLTHILPCNYAGIDEIPQAHAVIALVMTIFAAVPFIPALMRDFTRFRRP